MKISRLRRAMAVFLSVMLVMLYMPIMAITSSAADYSYDASENYVTYNSDGLTVRFTMTDCGLNMHYWTVFLFDPTAFSSVSYDSNHKLTNSGSMGLESAEYAFSTNNSSDAVYTLQTAVAAPSSEDLKGSGKYLSDVWSTKNWVVVLGPYHNWGGTNYYNCDYYIGNADSIPASAPGSAEEDTVISAVTVNVDTAALPTELAAGETPDTATIKQAFSVPNDANYSISDCRIADENVDNNASYAPGATYYMWMLISPATGYSFNANVTAGSADGKLIKLAINEAGDLIVRYPLGTVAAAEVEEPDPSEYDITTDQIKAAGCMDLLPGTRVYINTNTFVDGGRFYADTYESAASYGYIDDDDIDENYLYYYEEALTYGSIITLKSKYQANCDGDGDILCGGTWRCTVDGEDDGVLEIYSTTPTSECPDPDNPTPDPEDPHVHEYGQWRIVKEATSTEEGLLERVCLCGETETKVIDKLVDAGKDNDNGNVVDTTPDTNACRASLENIEAVAESIPLEPDEYIAIQDGADLSIYLEVVDVTDASETMSEEDKTLIKEKINSVDNMNLGMLIDVSLFKKIGNGEPSKVTGTKAPIKITFKIPDSLINKSNKSARTYYIIRVHNGNVDVINGSFNSATGEFTFFTDKFSSYAIAYIDSPIAALAVNTSSGHTHVYNQEFDETGHWKSCSCGSIIKKSEHTFGTWKTVKESTETEDGIKTRTCTVCGYSETFNTEDAATGEGAVIENDIIDMTEKDLTIAITLVISAAVIGMTIIERRKVRK